LIRRFQPVFALLVLIALPFDAVQAQPAERAPDTMAARVLACASCHGAQGEGTSDEYFPRLAGKPAGYLYNQLVAFKDARRKYPPMNFLLEFLPDAYLKQIAEHFASLRPPFPAPAVPVVSKEILARGEALVTHGDPQRGVPACAGCHGPAFTGMEPAIPGLLGLIWHADGRCPRLHAGCRRASDRRRREGGRRLAVIPPGAG
jgi:cytochrome c553